MNVQTSKRRTESQKAERSRWRSAFTPAKLLVAVGSLALALAVTSVVCAVVGTDEIGRNSLLDGSERFILQPLRDAYLPPVFFAAMALFFALAMRLFRKQLLAERLRREPDAVSRWESAGPLERLIGHAFGALVIGSVLAICSLVIVAHPYTHIREITDRAGSCAAELVVSKLVHCETRHCERQDAQGKAHPRDRHGLFDCD